MSVASWATASSSSGPRTIVRAPSCFSCSSAWTSGVDSRGGRRAMTHAIGSPMSRIGSVRIAAAVPPSAQWASSMEIRSGDSSAARSSSCCRSLSSQNRCSGCAWRAASPLASSSGSAPSNSAASSAASSTTVSLGSAALLPTLMPRLRAIVDTSASRRLFPMPAAPSTMTTASAPSERRSSSARISASSASRPWNSRAGLVDIRSSRRAYPSASDALSNRRIV